MFVFDIKLRHIRPFESNFEQLKESYLRDSLPKDRSDVNVADTCIKTHRSRQEASQPQTKEAEGSMEIALVLFFLAASSTAAPQALGLSRDMSTGHSLDTLATNQKRTSIHITKDVLPRIEHNFKMLKLSIEREHNETSQLYEYIDASIAHATKAIIETIIDMKTNTDESIKALEENTKENLVSMKTINNENNKKILETTVNSNNSALTSSLDWMSRRMDAAEVRVQYFFLQLLLIKFAFPQDILTSRVGVCGVSPKRLEPGVVNYDRILHHTEGDKKIRLAGKDLSVRPLE